MGDGHNLDSLEDWELVETSEARSQQLKARDLHHKRCDQEHRQAAEAHRALLNAQQAAELGKLRAEEGCLDDVHRACCVPGTAVRLTGVVLETPLVIRTATEHHFQDGQNVIITGLSLNAGAPHSVACTARELSRDHVVRFVDECRLSLPGMASCPCEPEEVHFINFDQAEVQLSISSWGMGRTPITHSALQAIAQTAKASGLSRAIETALATVRTACGGVQHCAETLAGHLEHRQRLSDGGSDALMQISSALKNVSGASVPVLEVSAKDQWDILREAVQPDHWIASRTCHACMECFKPLRALRCEQQDLPENNADWSSAHHCRHCGRFICQTCAVVRECVPWRGEFQPVLVCKPCKPVVLLRNLCLQHLQTFNAQIELAAAGLCPPVETKGRGKGPPPPPPKGKGRGSAWTPQSKAGEVPRGRGLGVLGDDIRSQLSELADFVVVPAVQARPRAISRPNEVTTILTKHESLKWHVASKGYRPHLTEILRCLGSLELQDDSSTDVWFDALEQILPLEEKLSEETLKQLKAVKPEDQPKLREYEQHIRLLLAVPELPMRWRTLRLLRDLRSEQESFISRCAAIQAACAAPLVCTDGICVLRSEVKNVIAALHHGIQPSCERLQELVSRTQVGSGKLLLTKLWQAGEKHEYKDFDTRGFVNTLAPVLLEGDAACAMQELLQRFLDLRKRHVELLSFCGDGGPGNICQTLEGMTLGFQSLEARLIECLELGGQFLVALGQWYEAKPVKSLSESAVLARAMDQNLQSLKNLTRGLRDARPEGHNDANKVKLTKVTKPAAKARSSRIPARAPTKAFKRKVLPDVRKGSKDRPPPSQSSDERDLPWEVPGMEARDAQELGSSSEETCGSDVVRPLRNHDVQTDGN